LRYGERPLANAHLVAPILLLATKQTNIIKRDDWAHLLAYTMSRPHEPAEELAMLLSTVSTEQLSLLRALRLNGRWIRTSDKAAMASVSKEMLSAVDPKTVSFPDAPSMATKIGDMMKAKGIGVLVSLYLADIISTAVDSFTDPRLDTGTVSKLEGLSLLQVASMHFGNNSRFAKLALWGLSPAAKRLLDIIDDD